MHYYTECVNTLFMITEMAEYLRLKGARATMASLGSVGSKPSCSGDKRKYSSGDSDEETRETVSVSNLYSSP